MKKKLKLLTVRRCNQSKNTFQLSTAVDILHLEELFVKNNRSMEEIISWEGERQDVTSKQQFPELSSLRIQAENLICFCKEANEIKFHQLHNLTLGGVLTVECLISGSDETPLKSIFPRKVSFPRLVDMTLYFLRNMKEIWCGQSKGGSFCKLSLLDIWGCDSLEYVIRECRSLKKVVAIKKEVDGQEEEDYTSSSILPKLEYVILYKLQALERFCHIADDLAFMELNKVCIEDCPEFETLAPGFVHTPNLNHVKLYDEYWLYSETKEKETSGNGNLNILPPSVTRPLPEDDFF